VTRKFEGRVQCPHCKKWHTQETAFERWMRNHHELDSRKSGIVRFDLDLLLHRYLTPGDKKGTREIQAVMFIEVKTRGGILRPAQKDTLGMLQQVLRNRRRNIHSSKKGPHAKNHCPLTRCWSHLLGRDIILRMFGGHLLEFECDSPDDTGWIAWDKKTINEEMLLRLLRFELDPDTLKPIDWRRRYSDFKSRNSQLFLFPEVITPPQPTPNPQT